MSHINDAETTLKPKKTREPPRKKARVSNNTATTGRGRVKTAKHLAFAILKSLPVDIVSEIFSHLDPLDLLHLTRTTKDLRQFLLGNQGRHIWKSVFENVPKVPECPDNMSLPAWANLVFDLQCHECGKPHHKNIINFTLRTRLCGTCAKTSLEPEIQFAQRSNLNTLILRCVPFSKWNDCSYRSCLVAEKSEFLKKLKEVAPDARQEFVNMSRASTKARIKHGNLCHAWLDEEASEREAAIEDIKEARKNAILERLRGLGYSEEVDYMMSREYSDPINHLFDRKLEPFEKLALVRVARPLTDHVWSNIRDKMIEHIEKVKARMLRQRRLHLEESRQELVLKAWEPLRRALGPNQIIPTFVDILSLHGVRYHVKRPSDALVTQNLFEHILQDQMSDEYLADFRARHLRDLADKVPGNFRTWHYYSYDRDGSHAQEKLELATSVFTCKRDLHHLRADRNPEADPAEDEDTPLFYPEFLYHRCNSICSHDFYFKEEDYPLWALDHNKMLSVQEEYRSCRQDKWSSDDLAFNTKAQGVVLKILEACSLPKTTKVTKLDELDPRLICLKCTHGAGADGERICLVWSWRNVVRHCLKVHWSAVPLQMILPEDAEKARALELLEPAKRSLVLPKPKLWRCTLCIDTPDDRGKMHMEQMASHFSDTHPEHQGELQEGPHYYKALDCPPPRTLTVKMKPKAVGDKRF